MTPIISPWVFYWIDLIENISCGASVFFVLIAIAIGSYSFAFFLYITGESSYDEKEKVEGMKKAYFNFAKKSLVALVVLQVIQTFIPDEKTMYTMLVAQNVTVENLETATDVIKDSVDYIFDKFDESEE